MIFERGVTAGEDKSDDGTQTCSLCARRSYTPLIAWVDRAFCAGDAAGCKPAGRTGQRPMFLCIVIPQARDLTNEIIVTQKKFVW